MSDCKRNLRQGEDFRFYKSGLYNNKKCSPKMKRLDHAVIVSGCDPRSACAQVDLIVICVRCIYFTSILIYTLLRSI